MKFGKWQTYYGIGLAHCCWLSLSIEFLHWSSIHPNINQISALIKLQKKMQKIWFQARLVCKQVGGWLQQKQGCGSRLVLQGLVLRPPPPPPPPPAPPSHPPPASPESVDGPAEKPLVQKTKAQSYNMSIYAQTEGRWSTQKSINNSSITVLGKVSKRSGTFIHIDIS